MSTPVPFANRLFLFLAACLLGMTAACSDNADDARRPAQKVGYVTVQPTAVPITITLGGRTVAYETSEVRPQVSGIITKRLFTEGGYVRAGQPLYQLDSSLYRAAFNEAQANLDSAKASASAATAKAERYRPLAEMEAIAQQDYTDAAAQANAARAAVEQNRARLETARINLQFATISAPISGRIGRSLVTVGALASASQAQPLAIIQKIDPIYVDMQQSSAELTALKRSLASGTVGSGSGEVRLKLEDGTEYRHAGRVEFSEVTVNEDTGTVTLRARFPNPDSMLLPGMFVTAVFNQSVDPSAYLVPQAALQRDFNGQAFVYVIGKDDKALRRNVTADRTQGTHWVVTEGLSRGDKVITQGLGTLRQGAVVDPVPADKKEKPAPSGGQADAASSPKSS